MTKICFFLNKKIKTIKSSISNNIFILLSKYKTKLKINTLKRLTNDKYSAKSRNTSQNMENR